MLFSYTRLKTYETCPAKYKHIYIDNNFDVNESLAVGSAIHTLIEEYLLNDINFRYVYLELYNLLKQDNNFDSLQLLQISQEILTRENFKQIIELYKNKNVEVEKSIYLNNWLSENDLVAKIDILRKEKDNEFDIIDFKTSKNYNGKYYPEWDQLVLYANVTRTNYYTKCNKANLKLHYVRDNTILEREVEEKEMNEVNEKYKDIAKKLLNDTEYKEKPNKFCNFCNNQICKNKLKNI